MPRSLAPLLLLAALLLPAAPGHAQRVAAGQFTVACDYSHTLPDDPIVAPGRPGAAHAHDFAGARGTNAFSTELSLLESETTCSRTGDHAGYWVPALLHHGRAYQARQFRAYYRGGGFAAGEVRPFPEGLRIIAGDAKVTDAGPYQPLSIVSWACSRPGDGPDGQEVNEVHVPADCGGEPLRMRIVFPQCWNGRDLDAPDHKSHMTYASRGRCPVSHPVVLPQLTLSLRYRVPDTTGISLSSGGSHSQHADFWSVWQPGTQEELVERCINSGVNCAGQEPPGGTAPAPAPVPAVPPAVAPRAPAPRTPAPAGARGGGGVAGLTAAEQAAAKRAAAQRAAARRRAVARCAAAERDLRSRSAARRAAARRGLANCTTAERRAAKRLAAERAAARCAAARRAARGGSAARRAAARRTLARCAAARRTAARRATARRAARRAARAAHHHGH